jgi:hypothetical protein
MRPGRSLLAQSFRRSQVAALLACAALALLGGCNVAGALAYKVTGPPPIPAKYVPAKVPTLVLVENSRNPSNLRLDADRLARAVGEELAAHQVAPITDPEKLTDFRRAQGAHYASLAITAVGRAVGADQVLYVDLIDVSVEPAIGSELLQGRAEARVRFVDVRTGQTLWPSDAAQGQPVGAATSYTSGGAGGGEPIVRDQLIDALADKVAKLFYTWKSDTVDGTAEEPLR